MSQPFSDFSVKERSKMASPIEFQIKARKSTFSAKLLIEELCEVANRNDYLHTLGEREVGGGGDIMSSCVFVCNPLYY